MNLYYEAPEQGIFDELKAKAIEIWSGYDDTHGYASSKINEIKDLPNQMDHFMYMVAMFDDWNQRKLSKMLTDSARQAVVERLRAGGTPDAFNNFLPIMTPEEIVEAQREPI